MNTWQQLLDQAITTIDELTNSFSFSSEERQQLQKITQRHPMRIPRYYLNLINPQDPQDPIRKLAVPSLAELDLNGEYDTSGEKLNTVVEGLQHKYGSTALLLATNQCAMYCRHCFRKRLVGLSNHETIQRFEQALSYIQEHSEINNILITGGDPFVLPTDLIQHFLDSLLTVKHLDFIRFGTRIPVTFPHRILLDKQLVTVLGKFNQSGKQIHIVTHYNHPREITPESQQAIALLQQQRIPIHNQTVFLRGVNDDPSVLARLMNQLARIGVIPYYLFQCRPVKHVQHSFQIPLSEGYPIVEKAKKQLNGISKRFRFVMSHQTGKIEIIGINGNEIFFKYHQARNPANLGHLFKRRLNRIGGWLDDFDTIGTQKLQLLPHSEPVSA